MSTRKILKLLLLLLLGIFLFLGIVITALFSSNAFQNFIANKASGIASEQLETEISIQNLSLQLNGEVGLNNVLIKDQQDDTLLFVKNLNVDIGLLALLKKDILLEQVHIQEINSKIYQIEEEKFNFSFLIPPPDTTKKSSFDWGILIGDAAIEKLKFSFKNESTELNVKNKNLELSGSLLLGKNMIQSSKLLLDNPNVSIKISPEETTSDSTGEVANILIPDIGLKISNERFQLSNGHFTLFAGETKTESKKFNAQDMDLENINLSWADLNWEKTNLSVNIQNLSASDHCGLKLEKFQTKAQLSDTLISLEETKFQSANSQMDFVAKAFLENPAALYTLDPSNTFDVQLNQSYFSQKDLNFFLDSALAFNIPKYQIDGNVKGSFADLEANNLHLKIGDKSYLKLDGKIRNVLNVDSLEWENTKLELLAYETDLNPFLKSLLPETKVFYYPNYSLKANTSGSLKSIVLDKTIIRAANDLWAELDGNYTHSDISAERKGQLSLNFRQVSENAFEPFTGENKWLDRLAKLRLNANAEMQGEKVNLASIIFTRAGSLNLDANAALANDFLPKTYSAEIQSQDFDLAKLELDSSLNKISFSANLKGAGTDLETLSADADLNISKLEYRQHQWSGIDLSANWQNSALNSQLNIQDSLAALQLSTFWKKSTSDSLALRWNIDSLLVMAFSNQSGKIISSGNANYVGDLSKHHNLKLSMDSVVFKRDKKELASKDIHLEFEQADSNHSSGNFSSDFLTAKWNGPESRQWKYLPPALLSMADQYFPVMQSLGMQKKNVDSVLIQQDLKLDIAFSQPSKWLNWFLPELKELDTLGLSLNWMPADTSLKLNLFAPKLNYAEIGWQSIDVVADGEKSQFDFKLQIDSIFAKDKLHIPLLELETRVLNDSLFQALNIVDDTFKMLSVNNLLVKEQDHFKLSFEDPFILNNENWTVASGNYVYIGTSDLDFEPLLIQKAEQQFYIGKLEQEKNGIYLQLKNFDIEEFTSLISFDEPKLSGEINARTALKFTPEFELETDIEANKLFIENEKAGTLTISGSYKGDLATGDIDLNGPNGQLQLFAEYNTTEQFLDAKLNVPRIPVLFIAAFLPEYVDSSSGHIAANANIKGSFDNLNYSGNVSLKKVRNWIKPLHTFYTVDGENITIDNTSFQVRDLSLKDRYGSNASINGTVAHNNFEKLELNLKMNAKDFSAFEIPKDVNQALSGSLKLDLDAKVRGTLEQPEIELDAKTKDKTDLMVSLIDEAQAISQEDYVFFYDPELDTTSEESSRKKLLISESGVSLFMNLEVNEDSKMKLIVDPLSGDYLELKGNSNLTVDIEPNKTPEITGTYTVKSGSYRFSYEQVLKKKFNIQEGSKIDFVGDPMQARLNIKAIYSTETTTYELIENQSSVMSESEISASRKKSKVNVLLNIGGVLSKPELSFDIQIPGGGNIAASSVARRLAQLRQDETELNKQVFGLLLFNSFISTGGSNIGSSGEAAALNSISKLINNQLNKLAQNHVKAIDISFAFDAYRDKFSETDKTIAEVGLDLSKSFLNDRLSVTVGGNLNIEDEQNTNEEARAMQQVSNDFVIEYKLTENGRYRVKVFQESNYDLVNSDNVFRTGAGISFSETFGKVLRQKKDAKTEKEKKEESDEE